ncbi:MAG: hypothetical protein AB1465_06010 [Patescibacteria group bacterium]
MKTKKPKITLEKLAQMINKGFETTATKEDIKDMATKADLEKTKEELKNDIYQTGESLLKQIRKLRGDLIIIVRKEDKKVEQLIKILSKKIF